MSSTFGVFTALLAVGITACGAEATSGDGEAEVGSTRLAASAQEGGFRWRSLTVDFQVDRWSGFSAAEADFVEDTVLGLNDDGRPMPVTFHKIPWGTTPPGDYVQYEFDAEMAGGLTRTNTFDIPGSDHPKSENPGATIWLGPAVWVDGQGVGHGAGMIRHEMGHALGLIHEHTRSDRDTYVTFHCDCYDPDPTNDVDDDGCDSEGNPLPSYKGSDPFGIDPDSFPLTPYGYDSVMHYTAQNGYSENNCPTLTRNDGGADSTLGGSNYTDEDRNQLWQMYEPQLGVAENDDELGAAMVVADFDGDGYDDLAVGAPGEGPGSNIRSGAVFIYKGTYATGLVPWKVLEEADFPASPHNGDRFGAALAAYTMNGGDRAELFVGAPGYRASGVSAGAVFYYRSTSEHVLEPEPDFLTQSRDALGQLNEAGDEFGAALAIAQAGPNGSRYLIVGAPGEDYNGDESGYVTLFRWSANTLTYFAGFNNSGFTGGAVDGDRFGQALAAADLDGDEVSDIVVGAPGVGSGRGAVYVLGFTPSSSGTPPYAIVPVQRLHPSSLANGDAFGAALAMGNLDGDADGNAELVVGAPYRATGGRVSIYADGTSAGISLSLRQIIGGSATWNDRLGSAVASGDFDDDGRDDVIVGVPGRNGDAGAVWFFASESDGSVTFTTSRSYGSVGTGDLLGSSVAIGDFNDNGAPNPAAGAPGRNGGAGELVEYHGGNPTTWREISQETSKWR